MQKIRLILKRLKRSFDYAVFGWSNPDWDFVYLYDVIAFKLLRIHAEIGIESGRPEKFLRALRLAIKLSERLAADDYDHRHYHKHVEKWGEISPRFGPETTEGYCEVKFFYSKADNDEQAKQAAKEYDELVQAGERSRQRDKEILFDLIEQYDRSWWS